MKNEIDETMDFTGTVDGFFKQDSEPDWLNCTKIGFSLFANSSSENFTIIILSVRPISKSQV
jgi:hypothetical protein